MIRRVWIILSWKKEKSIAGSMNIQFVCINLSMLIFMDVIVYKFKIPLGKGSEKKSDCIKKRETVKSVLDVKIVISKFG